MRIVVIYLRWIIGIAYLIPLSASAQQVEWAKMPRMQLERQFAGPLQDTVIQRWRDPADGTVCYLYIPIVGSHSAPTATGYVQYGPNTIGSLSCVSSPPAPPQQAGKGAPKGQTAPPAAPKGETAPPVAPKGETAPR